jgi:hypothetical protein
VSSAIEQLSTAMEEEHAERIQLQLERRDVVANLQRAEAQLLAIGELLTRYGLLNARYTSDLDRLDFIAEGAHFFNGLQEVRCPLCDQAMGDDHRHWLGEQARQSHGKGVRAILYAAFVVGLFRYCRKNKKPHPGFVAIDSPLTTYKKGQPREQAIDPGIEAAFWQSLAVLPHEFQIVVLDNKEPPASVASAIKYERFAGPEAKAGERAGFIPDPRI